MNDREFSRLVQAQIHRANNSEYRMDEHDRRCTRDQGNGTSIYEYPNGAAIYAQTNNPSKHLLKATGTCRTSCDSYEEARAICAQGTIDR